MGPNPSAPKNEKSEQQILEQAKKFYSKYSLKEDNDLVKQSYQLAVARILACRQKQMLDHLDRTIESLPEEEHGRIIKDFLDDWTTIKFADLDFFYQNWIKNGTERIEKGVYEPMSSHSKQKLLKLTEDEQRKTIEQGELALAKTCVVLFLNQSFLDSGETSVAFYKEGENSQSLFNVLTPMIKSWLSKIAYCYLFIRQKDYGIVQNFVQFLPDRSRIHVLFDAQRPILDAKGNICLAKKGSCATLSSGQGSGKFFSTSVEGKNILQWLGQKAVEYVYCIGVDNYLQQGPDCYLLGRLAREPEIGTITKCTYAESELESTPKRMFLMNGVPVVQNLTLARRYNIGKHQKLHQSPIWMNHSVHKLKPLYESLKKLSLDGKQTISINARQFKCWNVATQAVNPVRCFCFQTTFDKLVLNKYLNVQCIMVDRSKEYAPAYFLNPMVDSLSSTWKEAYKIYKENSCSQ